MFDWSLPSTSYFPLPLVFFFLEQLIQSGLSLCFLVPFLAIEG